MIGVHGMVGKSGEPKASLGRSAARPDRTRYRITIAAAARPPRWLAESCFHTRPAMFL